LIAGVAIIALGFIVLVGERTSCRPFLLHYDHYRGDLALLLLPHVLRDGERPWQAPGL
jgi:hypothetical protein